MKIQTFSIVVGTQACDARCPFCISKMTGMDELPATGKINYRNLDKALHLANMAQTTTCLITGKGEPTLYPKVITGYLMHVGTKFPFIDLQTNGLQLGKLAAGEDSLVTEKDLRSWYDLGLTTIALSTAGVDHNFNAKIYSKDYPTLEKTVYYLHKMGFSVRLCVMLMYEGVDTVEKMSRLIQWCIGNGVEQLTVRPIRKVYHPGTTALDVEVSQFFSKHVMDERGDFPLDLIFRYIRKEGRLLLTMMHGAEVYDVGGQNVCLSDCLTVSAVTDDIRTLIFYGDGRISYDWQYRGGVLVGGHSPPEEMNEDFWLD